MMSAAETRLTAEARVPTHMPRRYLGQLCKHFQHKLPVTLDEWQGRIAFADGVCDLEATAAGDILLLRLNAPDADSLARLQAVVGRHLERFAFRDELKVHWTEAA